MSDYAINLLKAIESGDQNVMSNAFADAMGAKIGDAIDAKKIEIAQNIYSGQIDNAESDVDSGDEVDTETTETSDENGTEEV
jgi:hypothetical protein